MEIDERKGSIKVLWHDVYDLNMYVAPNLVQ
jgi:hypothetical protein